jgi:hypothetical protein
MLRNNRKNYAIACLSHALHYNRRFVAAERGIMAIVRRCVGK